MSSILGLLTSLYSGSFSVHPATVSWKPPEG